MPKIIENLETRLIAEARRQVEESGYSAMTIRSVAKACGVGVGTVYNYFPSKDNLLATYLLEDWSGCIRTIEAVSAASDTPEAVVRSIHDQLCRFAQRHQAVFQDPAAAAIYAGTMGHYHGMLRGQLSQPLRKFCGSAFAAEFIAEALLTWILDGTDFDELYGMVQKLF